MLSLSGCSVQDCNYLKAPREPDIKLASDSRYQCGDSLAVMTSDNLQTSESKACLHVVANHAHLIPATQVHVASFLTPRQLREHYWRLPSVQLIFSSILSAHVVHLTDYLLKNSI